MNLLRRMIHQIGIIRDKIIVKFREIRRSRFTIEEKKRFVSKDYKQCIGRELNWEKLTSYSAKMQFDKVFNVYPLKIRCTDKITVRDYVKDKIGEEYLVPILGIYDKPDNIDFNSLPNSFVIKMNTGSGTNVIVKNKEDIAVKKIIKQLKQWMKIDYSLTRLETHYGLINPRIYIEQYLSDPMTKEGIMDYKFLCFHGKPYYVWVDVDRYTDHRRNVYNLEWELQNFTIGYENASYSIKKPDNLNDMIDIVKLLCADFVQVRVDLYNIEGKIYFGELTFSSESGLAKILPESVDNMLGSLWHE